MHAILSERKIKNHNRKMHLCVRLVVIFCGVRCAKLLSAYIHYDEFSTFIHFICLCVGLCRFCKFAAPNSLCLLLLVHFCCTLTATQNWCGGVFLCSAFIENKTKIEVKNTHSEQLTASEKKKPKK